MVPQAGECCAWQLKDAIGEYSTAQAKIAKLSEIQTFFPGTSTKVGNCITFIELGSLKGCECQLGYVLFWQISIRIQDEFEAEPPYFPKLKGPAFIYCGIILGGFSFIMLGFTPVLMFLIQ
eukprot:scaffold72040_cov27-Prasinocladus_malaysianus.AAC.1